MPTIVTNNRPDAVPYGISSTVAVAWAAVCEAPMYDVPQQGFTTGGSRETVPGLIEVVAPLILCNVTSDTAWFSLRISRSNGLIRNVAHRVPVPAEDVVFFSLNGHFLLAGDVLEAQGQTLNALQLTMSYTQGLAEVEV